MCTPFKSPDTHPAPGAPSQAASTEFPLGQIGPHGKCDVEECGWEGIRPPQPALSWARAPPQARAGKTECRVPTTPSSLGLQVRSALRTKDLLCTL